MENRQLKIRGLADAFCKNDFALQLLVFGNFVDEADRSPIEIQFTANFLQIPEKFCSMQQKNRQNSLLEAFACVQ
jgi:hypothetical protein